jgi:hypothetical protein
VTNELAERRIDLRLAEEGLNEIVAEAARGGA